MSLSTTLEYPVDEEEDAHGATCAMSYKNETFKTLFPTSCMSGLQIYTHST